MFFKKLLRLIIRTSVGQTQLPVFVRLSADRFDQLLKIRKRCTVQRNYNADQRFLCKRSMLLPAEYPLICFMPCEPRFITALSHIFFSKESAKESLRLIFFSECFNINITCFCDRITAEMKNDLSSFDFRKCR